MLVLEDKSRVATPYNNPGAADGIKILVVMQRLLAAADQERYLSIANVILVLVRM
jgi:hypothetical protein